MIKRQRFEGLYDRSCVRRAPVRTVPVKTALPGVAVVSVPTKKPKKDKKDKEGVK